MAEQRPDLERSVDEILRGLTEPLSILDNERRFIYYNRRASEFSGIPAEHVLGRTLYDAFPMVRGSQIGDAIDQAFITGRPQVVEVTSTIRPDRRVEARIFPSENGVVCLWTDITEQAIGEGEIPPGEQRARFLVELGDAMRPLSDPFEIIATSARLLGEHLKVDRCAYAEIAEDENHLTIPGDYTAPGIPSIVGDYVLSDFGAEVLQLHQQGQPFVIEDIERQSDPEVDLSSYAATSIRAVISIPLFKEGRFVAGMAVHMITPRIWTPDDIELVRQVADRCWESIERARAVRTLSENEQQFRTLADSIPQLAWMAEPDGHIFWYNNRWYEYTGTVPEQMEGWGWQSVHDPEMLPAVLERWIASIATARPFDMIFPLRGADGVLRPFLTRVLPVKDSTGAVVRWFGTNTDVTNEQRAQEERELLLASERSARTEAERANRMKDEFLTTLSHELRTPLNAMLGWSDLLRAGELDPEEMRIGLNVIYRNVRAQTQIVDDLLDMSRVISGKILLAIGQVDLAGVIEDALETVTAAAAAKDVRIDKILEAPGRPVMGDPNRLRQVVWNILSNAVKFTPQGGRVQITLAAGNSHVEITVSDTGVGISPEDLPHIFERFRQADSSTTRQHGGLGLGLAIAKSLVELHGGTIRAESKGNDQGTTFVVSLPVATVSGNPEIEEIPRTERTIHDEVSVRPLSLTGVSVLVIDDDTDARDLVRRVLAGAQATVETASSANEGLALLCGHPVDVVVCDIGMPGMDGYQFIRELRTRPAEDGGNVLALALTAFARSEDRTRAIMAGFQAHVAKPVEPAELIVIIASLVGRIADREEERST